MTMLLVVHVLCIVLYFYDYFTVYAHTHGAGEGERELNIEQSTMFPQQQASLLCVFRVSWTRPFVKPYVVVV